MNNIWKSIWHDANYFVNDYGIVAKCVDGIYTPLKQRKDKDGYLVVNLRWRGTGKSIRIHRLVAQMFLGYMISGYEVNHLDGNKSNNHYLNLEIVTHADNMTHATINGLTSCREGCSNTMSKLTENDVLEIRRYRNAGTHSCRELSLKFGVSAHSISQIANRKRWKHI